MKSAWDYQQHVRSTTCELSSMFDGPHVNLATAEGGLTEARCPLQVLTSGAMEEIVGSLSDDLAPLTIEQVRLSPLPLYA
jgi:hypothetical protein